MPTPGCDADADLMVSKVTEVMSEVQQWGAPAFGEGQHESVKRLSKTAKGSLSATASIVGGFIAQEVTKLSGKYSPIDQWSHFEFLEVLPDTMPTAEDCAPTNSRYDGQIAVFGKEFQEKVQNLTTFVVGAGALGCELCKGLCMMGAGTGEDGMITITDMDTIERSNLSRQFLFRPPDIDKPKSEVRPIIYRLALYYLRLWHGAGCSACYARNEPRHQDDLLHRSGDNHSFLLGAAHHTDCKLCVCGQQVGTTTEHIFTPELWDSQAVLINALDNEEARNYVDTQAVWYNVPLLESATTGVHTVAIAVL